MADVSNLETLAKLVNTTPTALYEAARRVTELPDLKCLPHWLEERLSLASRAYAAHFRRQPDLKLQAWVRRTLSFVVGPMPDASDAEFYKACADSVETYLAAHGRHEVVLLPSAENADLLVERDIVFDQE
jgi:hypothetical protein